MTRRRRGLTEDDIALWAHVTRGVEPIVRVKRRRAPRKPAPAEAPGPSAAETPAAAQSSPPAETAAAAVSAPSAQRKPAPAPKRTLRVPLVPPVPPLAPIDRQERRKVVRGTRPIDGRIDLHGLRQSEAHGALRGFLAHSQMRGDRFVLVITGKGRGDEHGIGAEGERGVLRRLVPQWLRLPELRTLVVGFEEAHAGHGGAGALYVRLRRHGRGDGR